MNMGGGMGRTKDVGKHENNPPEKSRELQGFVVAAVCWVFVFAFKCQHPLQLTVLFSH